MDNEVMVREERSVAPTDMYLDFKDWEDAQRRALALSSSVLVPKRFQGKSKVGDVLMAMYMAKQYKVGVLTMMQNLYEVNGNPGIAGKFIHAQLNRCGRFDSLDFDIEEKDGVIQSCTAYAKELRTGKLRKITLKREDVEKSGWLKQRGSMPSPWSTMPRLMFIYRTASWFCKAYAPDLMMGYESIEEVKDAIVVEPSQVAGNRADVEPVETSAPETGDGMGEGVVDPLNGQSETSDIQEQSHVEEGSENINWWENEEHWIYRTEIDLYIAVMVGFGMKYEPHEVVMGDGENVVLDEQDKEVYTEFSTKNPGAVTTLRDAEETTIQRVRRKFVHNQKLSARTFDMWLERGI